VTARGAKRRRKRAQRIEERPRIVTVPSPVRDETRAAKARRRADDEQQAVRARAPLDRMLQSCDGARIG